MKKILLVLLLVVLAGCEGVLWEGTPRAADTYGTVTVTIDSPLWIVVLHSEGIHDYCNDLDFCYE